MPYCKRTKARLQSNIGSIKKDLRPYFHEQDCQKTKKGTNIQISKPAEREDLEGCRNESIHYYIIMRARIKEHPKMGLF